MPSLVEIFADRTVCIHVLQLSFVDFHSLGSSGVGIFDFFGCLSGRYRHWKGESPFGNRAGTPFGFGGCFGAFVSWELLFRYFDSETDFPTSETEIITVLQNADMLTFENESRVSRIGGHAFGNCCPLTSIRIPPSVKSIVDGCFHACRELSTVSLESNPKLVQIEELAVTHCESLSSISLPSSVEFLCRHCFVRCRALSMVNFASCSTPSRSDFGAFRDCSSLSAICIPSFIEDCGPDCFVGCQSLRGQQFAYFSIARSILGSWASAVGGSASHQFEQPSRALCCQIVHCRCSL
jgi:hypothetical protein